MQKIIWKICKPIALQNVGNGFDMHIQPPKASDLHPILSFAGGGAVEDSWLSTKYHVEWSFTWAMHHACTMHYAPCTMKEVRGEIITVHQMIGKSPWFIVHIIVQRLIQCESWPVDYLSNSIPSAAPAPVPGPPSTTPPPMWVTDSETINFLMSSFYKNKKSCMSQQKRRVDESSFYYGLQSMG